MYDAVGRKKKHPHTHPHTHTPPTHVVESSLNLKKRKMKTKITEILHNVVPLFEIWLMLM